MKFSLITFLMLCFGMSFAQLSVRNDSYVFVDDQVLYVNDGINLQEATAKIYLRDEAQLIQGTGTTGNSGLGKLSVYQTGTANTYAYNYWCSPVGYVLESDNSNPLDNHLNNYFKPNANIFEDIGNVDPILDPITSTIANYTPTYNGTATPFLISQRWIYSFDAGNPLTPNDYLEWDFVSQNGTVEPAHGFIMKGNPSSEQLYDFRGKPNNGEMTAEIIQGERTLVGNPYPSALDALEFIHDLQNNGLTTLPDGTSSGMSGVLYYWEQAPDETSHYLNQYHGGYATYTISTLASGAVPSFISAPFTTYNGDGSDNTIGNAGTDGIKIAHRYIPIGQGFMVEGAAESGNSLVYFKNSHRIYYKQSGANSYFFRNNSDSTVKNNPIINKNQYDENGNTILPEDFKRFRINVDFNDNSAYTRQLLINLHHTATNGFDYGLEGQSFTEDINSDAHWVLDGEPYIIQAFNFEESLKIPLVVNIEAQQPLRFRIFDIQNFEESQGIYIHDIENETYVNLRNQDYELNIEPGNYTDRFEIVFTTDDVLDLDEFDVSTLIINQNNKIHQLSVRNPKGLDITAIAVYDISGKRLLQSQYDTLSNRYELSTSSLSDGVHIVKVSCETNSTIKSQKIIVKN